MFCLYVHMCVCMCTTYISSPRTGVADACRPLWGCGESNPDPLQEQRVPLNAEPSLLSLLSSILIP